MTSKSMQEIARDHSKHVTNPLRTAVNECFQFLFKLGQDLCCHNIAKAAQIDTNIWQPRSCSGGHARVPKAAGRAERGHQSSLNMAVHLPFKAPRLEQSSLDLRSSASATFDLAILAVGISSIWTAVVLYCTRYRIAQKGCCSPNFCDETTVCVTNFVHGHRDTSMMM